MGKVKNELQKVYDDCYAIYQTSGGYGRVFDHVAIQKSEGNPDYQDVVEERCEACDADMPSLNHICLICGQETKPMKYTLVDAVIESLKKDFAIGDYTVLDELLNKLQIKTLVQALPEERWDEFKELNCSYFEIMHQDYYEDAGFEEIQVHCGEHGSVYLKQDGDKLGFIIDVYGENDLVDTMTVWEEDLDEGTDEDEKFDPNNFSMVEKEDFIDEWGQYTDEVCAELGYDEKTSDDLLMVDYFFHAESKKWIPKISSLYSEREQAIADYLKLG